MLLPPQVNAVYRRLAKGEKVGQIDGITLVRKHGVPTDWGEVVASEAPAKVAFRPPEFVIGDPEDPSCLADVVHASDLEVPAKTIRRFRGVRIAGWRSLLSKDGFFSTRREFHLGDETLGTWSPNPYDGLAAYDGNLVYPSGESVRTLVAGNTLFLSALEPANHGSFVFRALPKLLYFLEQGLAVDQLVVPSRTPAVIEALGMFGLGALPVYSVPETMALEFANVLVVDDFDLKGAVCEFSMSRLRALTCGCEGDERVYVSRRLNAHKPLQRPLLNEAEIERVVSRMGFKVVFPEVLRFRQQISLFSSAGFIVGPSGSGMLNTLFSPAGARVLDMESFHSTVRQHARIYSSASHRYGFAFGRFDKEDLREPRHRRRWMVPASLVAEGIERLQQLVVPDVARLPRAGARAS